MEASNKLNAFIHQVSAQRGKKLTEEEADLLIAEASRIIAAIEAMSAGKRGLDNAGSETPGRFFLDQNYPNPFNGVLPKN